ncbi:Hypothetical predicted protein [Mytilus galloprovincialis]|uniref:Uncharacterized protein n=1 Tax=Mytilus galloprovincialis TaxID=29158 RepID=A0A8B6FNQ8_MYTGA|nr:Hypothetical predicted protein [Mytilus galloprovincialis]
MDRHELKELLAGTTSCDKHAIKATVRAWIHNPEQDRSGKLEAIQRCYPPARQSQKPKTYWKSLYDPVDKSDMLDGESSNPFYYLVYDVVGDSEENLMDCLEKRENEGLRQTHHLVVDRRVRNPDPVPGGRGLRPASLRRAERTDEKVIRGGALCRIRSWLRLVTPEMKKEILQRLGGSIPKPDVFFDSESYVRVTTKATKTDDDFSEAVKLCDEFQEWFIEELGIGKGRKPVKTPWYVRQITVPYLQEIEGYEFKYKPGQQNKKKERQSSSKKRKNDGEEQQPKRKNKKVRRTTEKRRGRQEDIITQAMNDAAIYTKTLLALLHLLLHLLLLW